MKIKPLADRVLIKRSTAEEKSPGGIIIPENVKEKPVKGEILAVGQKVKDVKAGDVIMFGKYAGSELKVDGEEMVIMREEDLLCVIEQ